MKNSKKGFTLIELLVVITIIGLLAGLAVPAIGSALNKAKQAGDIANVRQLGLLMYSIANDNNGTYPTGGLASDGTRPDSATSTAFFNTMLTSKEIPEPKLVWSNSAAAKTPFTFATPALANTNLAFNYVKGLTTTDNNLIPLFVSRDAFGSATEFSGTSFVVGSNVWKDLGIIVYTVGNSSVWIKATGSGTSAKLSQALYSASDVTLGASVTLLKN